MVSDKRVFPTKDNNWVSLARKPMIADSRELEKIFKTHKQVCLLNLPPPEKKAAPRSKAGNFGTLLLYFSFFFHISSFLYCYLTPRGKIHKYG